LQKREPAGLADPQRAQLIDPSATLIARNDTGRAVSRVGPAAMQPVHVVTLGSASPVVSMHVLHAIGAGIHLVHRCDLGSAAEGHNMQILHARPARPAAERLTHPA